MKKFRVTLDLVINENTLTDNHLDNVANWVTQSLIENMEQSEDVYDVYVEEIIDPISSGDNGDGDVC